MGFKDLFSKTGRAKGRLARQIKSVTSPYGQSADRYQNMEQLLEDASDEAFVGLLRRFTITSSKSIEDEEEKSWAYRRLSAIGKPILPAVKTFCLEYDAIAWALRIIEDVAGEKEEWDILDALLEQHGPGYERDPSKKLQMLTHLADIDDPKVAPILVSYVEDADETVRYFAVEALIDIADEVALVPLCKRLFNEEEDSMRLKTRILEGLADTGWDVTEFSDEIVEHLGTEHAFDGKKITRR